VYASKMRMEKLIRRNIKYSTQLSPIQPNYAADAINKWTSRPIRYIQKAAQQNQYTSGSQDV